MDDTDKAIGLINDVDIDKIIDLVSDIDLESMTKTPEDAKKLRAIHIGLLCIVKKQEVQNTDLAMKLSLLSMLHGAIKETLN